MEFSQFLTYIISNAIMAYCLIRGYAYLSENILKINKKNILTFLTCIIINTINNYYSIVSIRIIIALVITTLMAKLIFKQDIKSTFYYITIMTCISLILELVTTIIFMSFIDNINTFNNLTILKFILSFINAISLLLIVKNKYVILIINKIRNLINNFFNFYTFILLIIFMLNIIMFFRAMNLSRISNLIIASISLLFLAICLKIIITDKYNNKILTEKNESLMNSFKAYSETIDECRELKHNLKNDLYALKLSASRESQELINTIIMKYNKKYEWINKINNIPEGLQGIVFLKINEAQERKVKVFLNTQKTFKTNKKDYLDLCNIVGILIDNAIEASEKTKNKIIEINISEKNDLINIRIINNFKNIININEIGKKNYSTKQFKSGLGLNYIKNLNNNIKVDFKIIDNIFITNVNYKNIKNKKIVI